MYLKYFLNGIVNGNYISAATLLFILLLSSATSTSNLNATEIDSFTPRFVKHRDALEKLNSITREFLQQCVDQANDEMITNSEQIIPLCHSILGSDTPWAQLETYLNTSDEIDGMCVDRKASTYKNFSFFDGFALYMAKLGKTMSIGNLIIGTDKIGHFIDQGYQYYTTAYTKGQGIKKAIEGGEYQERTYFGTTTTGVYSYSDLNANLRGAGFWNQLVVTKHNKRDDFMPYILWNGEMWILNPNRVFDWSEYFDGGIDESINCNKFSESLQEKFDNTLKELSDLHGVPVQCPMIAEECIKYVENLKYPEFKTKLVSPACLKLYEESLKN